MADKKTTYSTKNGDYTGKAETTRYSDGSTKTVNYKATGEGLSRSVFGPGWSQTSTTKVDSRGNSQTTTPKKSWW